MQTKKYLNMVSVVIDLFFLKTLKAVNWSVLNISLRYKFTFTIISPERKAKPFIFKTASDLGSYHFSSLVTDTQGLITSTTK